MGFMCIIYIRLLSDDQLDSVVTRIQSRFGVRQPADDGSFIGFWYQSTQQDCVRESQRRVDPGGCAMRRMVAINCRKYKVNGPLALWHIDGNCKLIR